VSGIFVELAVCIARMAVTVVTNLDVRILLVQAIVIFQTLVCYNIQTDNEYRDLNFFCSHGVRYLKASVQGAVIEGQINMFEGLLCRGTFLRRLRDLGIGMFIGEKAERAEDNKLSNNE
jgi:hypothetical protein